MFTNKLGNQLMVIADGIGGTEAGDIAQSKQLRLWESAEKGLRRLRWKGSGLLGKPNYQ